MNEMSNVGRKKREKKRKRYRFSFFFQRVAIRKKAKEGINVSTKYVFMVFCLLSFGILILTLARTREVQTNLENAYFFAKEKDACSKLAYDTPKGKMKGSKRPK